MNITIYSTTTCATCHIVTQWLDKHGLTYTKKDTDEDPAAMLEFMDINDGHVGVPFTVITAADGTQIKIAGYDISKFKQLVTA
jgi:arsenate reductase-like glutaredoxin family protein